MRKIKKLKTRNIYNALFAQIETLTRFLLVSSGEPA
jgi:hypothetical protein